MPPLLFTEAIVFLFGLGIGSFINVLVIRGHKRESLGGRSYCRSCHKTLSPKELIPVFSYILQKGRCRSCGAAFSLQYSLVELTTAVSFVLVFHFLLIPNLFLFSPFYFILLNIAVFVGLGALVHIFVADLKYKIIPDSSVLVLGFLGIAVVASRFFSFGKADVIISDLISALTIGLLLVSLWAVSRGEWMGLGDVKLIVPTSLILGFPASLNAFLFAFWLGGIAGVILLVLKKKKFQSQIPFGPFIIAGAVLAYLFGPRLIFLYG